MWSNCGVILNGATEVLALSLEQVFYSMMSSWPLTATATLRF